VKLSDYPEQRVDFSAQLHGTDRLTRRFVSYSSCWEVEWLDRWDGLKRLFIRFRIACPTEDWKRAVLIEGFGFVDWSVNSGVFRDERRLRDSIEDFCERVWRESRDLDFSMAAYCASNLWC